MIELSGDIFRELLGYGYHEFKKQRNRKKIRYFIDKLSIYIFDHFKIHFYTIIGVLVLMFIMNCIQFVFYVLHFQKIILYQPNTNVPMHLPSSVC